MILLERELSSLAKIGDGAHASLKRINKGIPYLTAKNISKSGIDYKNINYISEETYNKYFKDTSNALTQPKKDDILYSIIGSIGAVYVVRDEQIGISSSVAILRADKSKILPEYLAYYMNGPVFDTNIQAVRGGVAQGFMSLAKLGSIIIKYPKDITYQKKIVDILSTYDNLIGNNQKQIKLLEEAAQRLYKEWFIDLRFPEHENVEIVDGIPLGWHEDTIDTKVKLLNGFAFKSKNLEETGLFKLVTIKNVQDGYFEGKNVKYLSKIPDKMPRHCHLNEGDLLLSLTGNVGRVCMVEGNNFLLNQRVAKISSDTPAYTYCLFRSNDLFVKINNISNGAAQQNVSTIRIGQIKHWFPNDKLIMDFERLVSPILKKVVLMKKNIILLEEARDRLLPKLMSGEIEV